MVEGCFAFRIQVGIGFIQHKKHGITKQAACQRDALPLTG